MSQEPDKLQRLSIILSRTKSQQSQKDTHVLNSLGVWLGTNTIYRGL